jgi:hypothetical protein
LDLIKGNHSMARGGRRLGAGRKIGSLTKRTREIAERAAAEGVTPLEHMLAVMRDTNARPERRDDMAKAAAPYVHPKLATTELQHTGKEGNSLARLLLEIDGQTRGLPNMTTTA